MAHILVIDDDALTRQIVKVVLQKAGHEVTEAVDGTAGVQAYRANPADLVIVDMLMPEKTGWETICELRREFPNLKAIGISGGGKLGPHSYLMLAKRFGAKRVLMKPFKRAELLSAVNAVLQGKGGASDTVQRVARRVSEKKSVFILDRDSDHLWSLCEGLTQAGHTVTETRYLNYAKKILQTRVFDAAILDLAAISSGEGDLIKVLRESRSAPRIIVMTNFESLVIKQHVIHRGADHFINKPVDIEELLDLIVPPPLFRSQLEGFDILDYLQFILLTGKNTVVEVRSPEEKDVSKIYCREGNIVHALSGSKSGEAAFFHCVRFRGGTLCNLPWEEPQEESISKPGEFILLEAARRKDERQN